MKEKKGDDYETAKQKEEDWKEAQQQKAESRNLDLRATQC